MKIRRDTVFISSVLFTIAFFGLVPPFFKIAVEHDKDAFQRLDWSLQLYSGEVRDFSIAALAIILIGLIVIWNGYVKRVRWTWWVMFVIVWGWFFPTIAFRDFVYPLYSGALKITSFFALIRAAFGLSSLEGSIAHEMVIFALMVIALFLSVKAFFWGREKAIVVRDTALRDLNC